MSQYNDIKITPNIGVSSDPKIEFIGAGNSTITLKVLDTADGGITFEGQKGDILSLVDAGVSIGSSVAAFSVNDFYGIPQIEAHSDGRILLDPYGAHSVGIGTTNPQAKLDVNGNVLVSGVSTFRNSITGTISTSVNVIGGIASVTSLNVSGISTLGTALLAQNLLETVGIGTTATTQSTYKTELYGGLKVDDINTGSGKFNTNLSHSVFVTPTGVLNPVLTLPATEGKRYILHSVNVANVARVQPQGAGATVGINTLAGAVTSLTIDGVGVGYTDADIGSPTDLNVSFATTSYVGVGTTGDPAYSGITSALGYITSVSGGAVTGVAITFGGFGYTSPPVVTFDPPEGGGTTETGTAVLTYGEVTAAYLNVPGEGYTTPPSVSIASTTGTGVQITSDVDSDGKVIRLNLLSRGYGYSTNNALGNSEENEVYISLPPLAKTEVGVDVEIDRYPLGGGTTVSSYLAFDVPIPVGGVLEVLKQPAVLNPGDIVKIRGIDANGSGLSDAIDVSISYEVSNNSTYIGYGTATPANVGLGTTVPNIGIITATTNPVMVQSIRLTNTEFVGDYDVSVKVITGAGQTYYLARNLVIPSFASVELCDMPKRIEAGSYILMDAETVGIDANEASTIDIQVAGKEII